MVVSPKTWREVFLRDKGYCQYCGKDMLGDFSDYWSAQVDHIVPRSAGGTNDMNNLVLCCPACNSILSRDKENTTVESRRIKILSRRSDQMHGYMNWKKRIR